MSALTAEQRSRVERAAPRVRALARALQRRLFHLTVDELESAGYEALVGAAQRYEPDSGIPFARFAHYRVRGAMVDAARANDRAARSHRRALRALEASQSMLEQADASEVAASAESRRLEERVAAARALVERAAAAVALAHSAPTDPDEVPGGENAEDPEAATIAADTRRALWSVVHECTDEEQRLLRAIYEEGRSMKQLARAEGVAVSTISRRHAKLLDRLRGRLQEASG